ncbi:MAG TPA: efflux RND transporter periplasmic adaptor subunit [Draconibacterium sp.]|nr:efflux RND transporter periplasmic adaptor subunit [Draconibacterium sp.]
MKSYTIIILIACLFAVNACKNKPAENADESIVAKAAVSVTKPEYGNIESYLTLNGKTVLYKKNQEPAPISGYITAVKVQFGDKVEAGQVLFEIQTPENKAMEQSGNASEIAEFGRINVKATTSGIISEPILLGTGAFVTEGSVLCTIADLKDLLVRVNVPFEYHNMIKPGTKCSLQLPDNSISQGTVVSIRPFVDESSQTQEVLVKPTGSHTWPENMNLTVSFLQDNAAESLLLPKKALLTNETQNEFWVMKVLNDSIAVKVPVETGIKTDSLVEIVSAGLGGDDIIILEGGYGLEDSSLVTIVR